MLPNGVREKLLTGLIRSNPGKPVDAIHPQHQLEKLERMRAKAKLVSLLRSRGRLPDLATIQGRLARLSDEDYCFSEAHQAQLWAGDQGDSALVGRQFAKAFVKEAARLKIPLYAERFTVTTVEIVHCQWRYSLPADDWSILGYIGKAAGERAGLTVAWEPDLGLGPEPFFDPARWHLAVPAAGA